MTSLGLLINVQMPVHARTKHDVFTKNNQMKTARINTINVKLTHNTYMLRHVPNMLLVFRINFRKMQIALMLGGALLIIFVAKEDIMIFHL